MRAVVVTPIYRSDLSSDDRRALISFREKLSGYSRVAICPKGLDRGPVWEVDRDIVFEEFDRRCFASWQSYNAFCKRMELYLRFKEYDYILLAQLDAFVFRDELSMWCSRGLDYIGTAWPMNRSWVWHAIVSYGGGGGGFSLRRVSAFIETCDTWGWFLRRTGRLNEDVVFASRLFRTMSSLRRQAGLTEYLRFGFDAEPERCLALNGGMLPFGCHGWTWSNRRDFWEPYIRDSEQGMLGQQTWDRNGQPTKQDG